MLNNNSWFVFEGLSRADFRIDLSMESRAPTHSIMGETRPPHLSKVAENSTQKGYWRSRNEFHAHEQASQSILPFKGTQKEYWKGWA